MNKKRMLLFAGFFCCSLFFPHFFSPPAAAQAVMSSMSRDSVAQDSSAVEAFDVDCGDGTYCDDGEVCVADNQCCPEAFPYFCGKDKCALSAADCPEPNECPVQKILGQDNPQLENLRTFRDSRLARSFLGRKVIELYYNNAERINDALDRNPALRIVATRALEKIIPMLGN